MTSPVLKTLLAAAVLLLCNACSKNPLDTVENAEPAEELYGIWFATQSENDRADDIEQDETAETDEPAEIVVLNIGAGGEDFPENVMILLLTGHKAENELEVYMCAGYVTSIGEETYLNCPGYYQSMGQEVPTWDESNIMSYTFFRFTLDDEELCLYAVDDDRVKEIIENGELAGDINSMRALGSLSSAELQATTEELREYLAAGNTFFAEEPWLVLRRLEPPVE